MEIQAGCGSVLPAICVDFYGRKIAYALVSCDWIGDLVDFEDSEAQSPSEPQLLWTPRATTRTRRGRGTDTPGGGNLLQIQPGETPELAADNRPGCLVDLT